MEDEIVALRTRTNLAVLFNNTSIIPFIWRNNFVCLHCGLELQQYEELYTHTKAHDPFSMDPKSLQILMPNLLELKLDVSNLHCEVCEKSFKNLKVIVKHLIDEHNFEMDISNMDATVFNLKDIKCVICEMDFKFIQSLMMHVFDEHTQNSTADKINSAFAYVDTKFRKSKDRRTTKGHYMDTKNRNSRFNLNHRWKKSEKYIKTNFKQECDITYNEAFAKQAIKTHTIKENKNNASPKYGKVTKYIDVPKKYRTLRQIIRNNEKSIVNILTLSTAIPFKFYQNRFACFYCAINFLEHEEMREHTLKVHTIEDVSKELPGILRKLQTRACIDIFALSCRVCQEKFHDLLSIIDHLIDTHDVGCDRNCTEAIQAFKLVKYNMICPQCPEKFPYFNSVLKHINEKHSIKNHLCPTCGATFSSDSILTAHVFRAHEANYKCEYCHSVFKTSIKLDNHKSRMHGLFVFPCAKCPERFKTHYGKQKHLLDKHNVGFKCHDCDRMFTKDSLMRNHYRRIHLKERNIQCTVCKRKFFDNERLKFHMVTHVGSRNFQCDECGKSYFWKKNLLVHMSVHNKLPKTNQVK